MIALELSHLVKRFGALAATNDLSLSVEENELHAIIGPNGAGKTTMICQILGEMQPDSGKVVFFGEDVTDWPVPRRALSGLARSFQITQLCQGLTAEDNVALVVQARQGHSFRFWRNAKTDPALREPARAALARVGLLDKADVLVDVLAHGEKRQLELAVALAMEPRMLLLDEPMAGMGAEESERIVHLLGELKGKVTILLIEHDMDAVFKLADRISVLVSGHVILSGDAEAVRADPRVREAYLGKED